MTRLFAVAVLLFLVPALPAAVEVTLEWDASPSEGVEGYELFSRDYQRAYNYTSPAWAGTDLTCIVTAPEDRQTAYVVQAWGWGPTDINGERVKINSQNSNEVVFTPESPVIEPPRLNWVRRIIAAVKSFLAWLFA